MPFLGMFLLVSAFTTSYNDYLFNLDRYRQDHTAYTTARQAYVTYQTLTAKNEAQSKTAQMLHSRDTTLKTYLIALKDKTQETAGYDIAERESFLLQLDQEITWLTQHQDDITSAGSLEDLVDSSDQAKSQFRKTESLLYQALTNIAAAKENHSRSQLVEQVGAIREKLGQIRAKGDKKTQKSDRWLLEAENRISRSQEKQLKAYQLVREGSTYQTDRSASFHTAQFALEESHQYLKEANNYLKELIREIKTAD